MNKSQEWALVTGAGSGIGYELCRLLAQDGASLVLVDRDSVGLEWACAALQHDYGAQTVALVCDLSRQEAAQQVFDEVQQRGIALDVLVNNAGFGTYGNFWRADTEREQRLVNLNILTPLLLSRHFLPGMVERRRGRVLNIGSVSGFLASPHASTYYSSKAFLLSFSQGVAHSLRGTGVTMTVACPGPTHTAFNWHDPEGSGAPPERKKFQMTAADVALQAYRAMRRGQPVVIPGLTNKALAFMAKLLPGRLALWLVTRGQETVN